MWVRAGLGREWQGRAWVKGSQGHKHDPPASVAVRNPYTGSTFLLAALPASLLLLQWYEPLQKFLLLKVRGRQGGGTG